MRHNTNTITVKATTPYFVKLILKGTNRSMHLTFDIQKALDGTTGKMKNVFMLNGRTHLVEVQNEKQATVGRQILRLLYCTCREAYLFQTISTLNNLL
jgi:hypothetical protein